ncbi:MAG: hypothetical protein EA377_13090 [Phycisphaerales bacterium]|nr:MAG: hypothetical protein EA377_13090 [Phycisphaerales bacterium]
MRSIIPRTVHLAAGAALAAGLFLSGCGDSGQPTQVAERPNNAPGQQPASTPPTNASGEGDTDSWYDDGRPASHPTLGSGDMRGGGQQAPPTGQQMPPSQAVPPQQTEEPDDPTVATFLGLRGPKPASWLWRPPQNAMIHTNYTVPGRDGGRAAHINVYFFGEGMGGPIQMNIDRWQQQFRSDAGTAVEPVVEEIEVNGMEVVLVELEGEWMQMGQSWYTPNQLFLAAIVEAPIGRVFIRFAGPRETVSANREPFMEMIQQLEPIDEDADSEGDDDENDQDGGEDDGYGDGGY